MELTKEQLVECFDCVFTEVHSDGFKSAEMNDLINDTDYTFMVYPKKGWEDSLRRKLKEMGFKLRSMNYTL